MHVSTHACMNACMQNHIQKASLSLSALPKPEGPHLHFEARPTSISQPLSLSASLRVDGRGPIFSETETAT